LLAAFKLIAPHLGLSVRVVHALDWLFSFTKPQDWGRGGRPIVWPSAARQREALGLSPTQVKAVNRGLIGAGLITMRDSPNGKRSGKRDAQGHITKAYGFDLSPLASRYAEFVQLAAEAKAEREVLADLRRRATIARRAITQILTTVEEYGLADDHWSQLRHDTARLVASLRRAERSEEITIGVGTLERRRGEALARLNQRLETVNLPPKGAENRPHTITTNQLPNPEDTVIAHGGCNPVSASAPPDQASRSPQQGGGDLEQQHGCSETARRQSRPTRRPDGGALPRLTIDDLIALAPRLRTYLTTSRPTWPEVITAADWLRGELGVSQPVWGEACVTMGRETAAVAIAIVSAKPAEHFRSTPGGYFHGMLKKAKAGELNLAQTIWGLRRSRSAMTCH
jgi:replication initiation protein RepC